MYSKIGWDKKMSGNYMRRPLIHIHIPKTGGTWLNTTLVDVLLPHEFPFPNIGHLPIGYSLGDINSILPIAQHQVNGQQWDLTQSPIDEPKRPQLYQHGVKISICRNPFDLLTSYYFHDWGRPTNFHVAGLGADNPVGWDNINIVHGIKSFDGFIKRYCDPDFRWWHVPRKCNLFFQMFHGSGACGVDVILKYENLFEELSFFLTHNEYCEQYQLDRFRDKRSNETPQKIKKDYRSYYTDELRSLVEVKCADELRTFGYNFDGPLLSDEFYIDPETVSMVWKKSG